MKTTNKVGAYSTLASFYDMLMSGYPYEKLIEKLKSTLTGKGIDIGTGSAKIAIPLIESGLEVVGVDPSEEMLKIASINARNRGVKLTLIKNDCENIELTRVDFVTATCDVINYVSTIAQVKKLFKKVYDSLKVGGYFVFDVSSSHKLHGMVDEQYFEDTDEITYLWTNSKKGDKLIMDVAFFIPEGDKYQRVDERHTFLIMEKQFLVDELESLGFDVKVYGHNLSKYTKKTDRIFFFARKNG